VEIQYFQAPQHFPEYFQKGGKLRRMASGKMVSGILNSGKMISGILNSEFSSLIL